MWKVLIFVEAITLFGSITNFGVPGTYREFWQFESILLFLAISSATLSIILEKREAIRERGASSIRLIERVQVKILAIGLSIVVALLLVHLV